MMDIKDYYWSIRYNYLGSDKLLCSWYDIPNVTIGNARFSIKYAGKVYFKNSYKGTYIPTACGGKSRLSYKGRNFNILVRDVIRRHCPEIKRHLDSRKESVEI